MTYSASNGRADYQIAMEIVADHAEAAAPWSPNATPWMPCTTHSGLPSTSRRNRSRYT